MAASRALYVRLAENFRVDVNNAPNDTARTVTAQVIRESVAPALKADNARFDYARFFAACGLDASGNIPR